MEDSRQTFTIFVEGIDTVPPKVPVNIVDGEKYASRICEGLKETEYSVFDFSFEPWTAADLSRIPAWTVMITDARNGVYGEIVAGICNMTERMYLFMGGRRRGDENLSGSDKDTSNAGPPPPHKSKPSEENGGAGSTPPAGKTEQVEGNGKLAALETVKSCLAKYNSASPSETGTAVEDVPPGHPLHTAVVNLERFYGGYLPRPAIRYWQELLRCARSDDEKADEYADKLADWVDREIAQQPRRDGLKEGNNGDYAQSSEDVGAEGQRASGAASEIRQLITQNGEPADKTEHPEGKGGGGSGTEKQSSAKPDGKPKRGRPVDDATIRRADFAKPLREQGKGWEDIYTLYAEKYPRDVDASADTIRLALQRQYPEPK